MNIAHFGHLLGPNAHADERTIFLVPFLACLSDTETFPLLDSVIIGDFSSINDMGWGMKDELWSELTPFVTFLAEDMNKRGVELKIRIGEGLWPFHELAGELFPSVNL